MNSNIATSFGLIILLIAIKMLISAGFSALINSRKGVLKERADGGHRGALRALNLSEDSTHLLATQQFLSVLLNVSIVLVLALRILPDFENMLSDAGLSQNTAQGIAYGIVLILFSVLLVMVDRLATSLVIGRSENAAILAAQVLGWLVKSLSPVVLAIMRVSGRTAVLMGGSENAHLVTEEEIKTLVDAGSEEGVLEDEEKEMIYSIMRFGDTLAREVMVPRIDIISLNVDATLQEALDTIIQAGHSRIPVYRDTIDNIEGVLYAKDLLKVWRDEGQLESLQPLLREPHFVPETKKASDLLIELQDRKTHLVFVVDEYGGTAGLLTIEDLVEEIVGEIQDEYDFHEEAQFEKISETEYVFNARFDLDDLNHLLDVSIPTDESDTLGGYIFTELGRVPSVSDTFNEHGLEFRVLSVTGRRIRKVQVKKIVEPTEGQDQSANKLSQNGATPPSLRTSVDTQSLN